MKKKLLVVALAAILVIVAIAGTSLAYLQDTDAEDNVFTVGDVKIDLYENFDESLAHLVPSVGSAQAGTLKNGIKKEVFITNIGSEDAFVRVHIAIPAALDNGNPDFDASRNILHFNYDPENIGADKWDWSKTTGDVYVGDWNFYPTTINKIEYNVYVVTYEKALAPNEATVSAIKQVYMESTTTNEDIANLKETLGEEWHIYVAAEGVQAEGFTDAYQALNTAFGVPGDYDVDWTAAKAGVDTVKGNG